MLLSAVSVLVVAQSSSEIPEGLMNNPVDKHAVRVYLQQVVHIVTIVLRAVKNTQQPQLTCAHILQ